MEKPRGRGRPPVTTREAVEDVAMTLFEQRGIENTTVVDIAEACEMSKTSFFRYFSSKNEILWGPFEAHIARFEETLYNQAPDKRVMTAIQESLFEAVQVEVEQAEAWLRRFKFQNTEEQRPLGSVHWAEWEALVARFVRDRTGAPNDSLIPESIAGTVRGAFMAFIRKRVIGQDFTADQVMPELEKSLTPVFTGLNEHVNRIPRVEDT
ncbi:MAG: TetR/AcrR family transcriptional regulator [Gulosibacter sp.]|uniref:TetR/AcrR family transcriptional regulator n=1 Tax=Gulosibacter sp. TaxID=2817531 RepID=UPI003F8F0801